MLHVATLWDAVLAARVTNMTTGHLGDSTNRRLAVSHPHVGKAHAAATMTQPGCSAADSRQPSWNSRGDSLVVGIKASITSASDLEELKRCMCSIRSTHPNAFIYVVGIAAFSADVLQLVGADPASTLLHCEQLGGTLMMSTFTALRLAASFAAKHGAAYFAFLQHHMSLLLPLPLATLKCSFAPFQVRYHFVDKVAELERFREQTKLAAEGSGHRKEAIDMGNITSEIEHVPMHGFVASRKALHRLLAMRLFTTPSDVVDVHDDLATERLLAALARYWLDSPPLTCSLDGCSPPMCSTDDKGCLPAWERKEEAQCQAYFAYPEHFTTPNFGERARTSVSCGRNRTVLETPLLRHVGPPLRIARPLFAGLLPGPDGTALFGADAMARLEAEPPEARRVLIYLAGHRDSPVFDRWYPRALSLPQARDLWLVRDAAILLLNNNRALPTARLLEKLRPYRQRARWLIHTPVNPGARKEKKPGYLCGEMASLAYAAPIWSRYAWVLHSHADVFPTPEFFAFLADKLTDEESERRQVDMYVDRFPGGVRRKPRLAMEYVVFRTKRLVLPSDNTAVVRSAFSEAVHTCLTQRGTFPEDLLHQMAVRHRLCAVIVGAVKYPNFNETYNRGIFHGTQEEGIKTELFPGAMFHNHNIELIDGVMSELERNASAVTRAYPNAVERTQYPFRQPYELTVRVAASPVYLGSCGKLK